MISAAESEAQQAVVEFGRTRLPFQRYGLRDGAPLLCIGGPLEGVSSWRPVIDRLRDRMPIIVVDTSRLSRIQTTTGLPMLEEQVALLDRVVETVSPRSPVNMLGFSWGSVLAASYAACAPARVQRLLLGSFIWNISARARTLFETARLAIQHGEAPSCGDLLVTGFGIQLPVVLRAELRNRFQNLSAEEACSLEEQIAWMTGASWSGCGDLSAIQASTLLVHGSRDHLISAGSMENMRQQIGNANLTTIREAGHFLHLEHPGILSLYRRFFLHGQTTWATRSGRGADATRPSAVSMS